MMKKLFTIAILIAMIVPTCLEAAKGDGRKFRHQRKMARILTDSEDVNFWSGLFGRSKDLVDCRTVAKGNVDYVDLAILTGGMKNGYSEDQLNALMYGKTIGQ